MPVISAKAGIQGVSESKSSCGIERFWIPAFAGMTVKWGSGVGAGHLGQARESMSSAQRP